MQWSYAPGTVLLDKYRVESVIGRGGMATVLRATHLQLGEEVALKILSPSVTTPDVVARFLHEAQALVRLRGEHVARVFDVGRLPDGAPYTVMEYLRGIDLAGELKRRGALPPGLAVDYMLQACEALAEAHARGVIHRDVKPSNLFLTARPDGTPLIKVLDFGISKTPAGGSLTQTDMVMGTPGYMSPEQMKAARDVDARTDVWSLGIVLYECLSGRPPFQAEAFSAVVLKAATEPPPPLDLRLPRGLQEVVLRCLEKDRAARFASMADLAAALAPFAGDPRAAALVVDRTRLMLGAPAASPPSPPADPAETATTLQGSARARTSTRRFRYTLAGVVSLASVIGIVIAAVMSSGEDAGAPGRGSTVAALPVVPATPGDDAAIEPPSADPGDAPAAHDDATADARAKAQQCAELEVNQKWQDLMDCAGELAALATQDRTVAPRAEEFRKKAVMETAASLAAAKLKDAIAEGDLREAQKQLKVIGTDSFYFLPTSDVFHAAETKAVEDNQRKAQALLAKRDCAGVKRLRAQVNAISTAAVAGAVAAVAAKCVDRASSPPTDTAVVASGDPAPRGPCEVANVDDAMTQAQNQYTAGFAKAALLLTTKALACRQDVRMYRFAATYACAAHEAAAAKLYYSKLPTQFQGPTFQRCQQEGIDLSR